MESKMSYVMVFLFAAYVGYELGRYIVSHQSRRARQELIDSLPLDCLERMK